MCACNVLYFLAHCYLTTLDTSLNDACYSIQDDACNLQVQVVGLCKALTWQTCFVSSQGCHGFIHHHLIIIITLPFWCHAGVTVIGEVNAWTSNVMNLIWLIGTFTFAVVLAVVTEDIVATVLVSLFLPLCYVYLFTVSPL